MSENLQELRRKRGGKKANLTNFETFLSGIEPQVVDGSQAGETVTLADAVIEEIINRLQKLDIVAQSFDEIQTKIECLVDDADVEQQYVERNQFDDIYFALKSRAKLLVKGNEISDLNSVSRVSRTSNTSMVMSNVNHRIKLPTIKLPTFSGSYLEWLEFREMFQALIHNHEELTAIEKYQYLKSSLQGEAANIIKSLEFTAANYDTAWDLICERYNNERLMISNHVKALFNMEIIAKESSIKIRELIDTVNKNLRALKSLNQPVEYWDTLISHIICTKLDVVTSREWEEFKAGNGIPDLDCLKTFLKNRADLLETLETRQAENKKIQIKPFLKERITVTNLSTGDYVCTICKGKHLAYNCEELLKLDNSGRIELVKKCRLCVNCLKPGHFARYCTSSKCLKCKAKHNTILHHASAQKNAILPSTDNSNQLVTQINTTISGHVASNRSYILLSTAVVQVLDNRGNMYECRALLDNGSQSNFISEDFCDKLKLTKRPIELAVSGINQVTSKIKHEVTIVINSRCNNYKATLSCLVIPEITGTMPSISFNSENLNLPQNLMLADPSFSSPSKIQILIGSEIFWDLMSIGQKKLGKNMPILQKTQLGWIVSGPLTLSNKFQKRVSCNLSSKDHDLLNKLQQFWEVEECHDIRKPVLSTEEQDCENHFVQTITKTREGRFKVRIPFKNDVSLLGESRDMAIKRFHAIERKLQRDLELKRQYCDFMAEYEHLKHMTNVSDKTDMQERYYIPHHAVKKEDSTTTKIRVVFDASAKTNSGYSLNELQMVGPTIQQDLLQIVLRFRRNKIAISADIMKMYRQVEIAEDQRKYQSIVWRENPDLPLKTFELNTVTYGTAAASFLAIRALHQAALDNCENYPQAAKIIQTDFYVDDLLSGAESYEEAKILKDDVSAVLEKHGFILRKWKSNEAQLTEEHSVGYPSIAIGSNERTKTLGLIWNPKKDTFEYSINKTPVTRCTKRIMLSCIAQIFDPMGLIAPVVILAKVMIQILWQSHLDWDETVPSHIHTRFVQFCDELPFLNKLAIPRYILDSPTRIEIHGFSDSSETAYGACIYVRSVDSSGQILVRLLCAKSKVAPLKVLTMPRLELCGAVTLVKLMHTSLNALDISISEITYWCDSTVVLGWIKTPSSLLKPFVNHRISEIQKGTKPGQWKHVSSGDNPADLLSRGVKPSALLNNQVWWNGPRFLSEPTILPKDYEECQDLPEIRRVVQVYPAMIKEQLFPFSRFSKLQRIQATMAYVLRFVHLKKNILTGPLTVNELEKSLIVLIGMAQQESFPEEYKALANKRELNPKSKIYNLNPFLHADKTIRVGGRLQNSEFEFEKKHPIIIDCKHHLTQLIFLYEHERLLHASPQLLLASLREKFWPVGGRNCARKIVHSCIRCFKANPKVNQPFMGNLPKQRVTPSLPFENTGVDYAGPFLIKDRKGRGCKSSKCYIALFICFVTKAIHLELVTALSTEAFMMAFKRFISRRGRPSCMFSDNGTNFQGAHSELKELGIFLQNSQNEIIAESATEIVDWKFIPAYSPNFGGLWEAGVRSVKNHLKRVIGINSFTYEMFYTLLTQIEAVLNSRPLSPLSTDPNDYRPLTPSHFLIGRAAAHLPDYDVRRVPTNQLNTYQHIEAMKLHFWSRWSKEYVHELQQRTKWRTKHQNLQPNELVVILDSNLPPQKWHLGRVIEVHPGTDFITRVVSIKTAKGEIKRAVSKVCPLPIENHSSEQDER